MLQSSLAEFLPSGGTTFEVDHILVNMKHFKISELLLLKIPCSSAISRWLTFQAIFSIFILIWMENFTMMVI